MGQSKIDEKKEREAQAKHKQWAQKEQTENKTEVHDTTTHKQWSIIESAKFTTDQQIMEQTILTSIDAHSKWVKPNKYGTSTDQRRSKRLSRLGRTTKHKTTITKTTNLQHTRSESNSQGVKTRRIIGKTIKMRQSKQLWDQHNALRWWRVKNTTMMSQHIRRETGRTNTTFIQVFKSASNNTIMNDQFTTHQQLMEHSNVNQTKKEIWQNND